MLLTTEEVKKHLNLDPEFMDDDTYIESLIEVCELSVAKELGINVVDLVADYEMCTPIKQAILLQIGTFYSNRESVTFGTPHELPNAFRYLIQLYKHY